MEIGGRMDRGTHLLNARGMKKRSDGAGKVQVAVFHRFGMHFGLQLGTLGDTLWAEWA